MVKGALLMKSLCIKINDNKVIDYLLNKFHHINLENIYFSTNKFKNYKNVVIHYTGRDIDSFYNKLSSILSSCVIDVFEENLLKNNIFINYFYFNLVERKQILSICYELIKNENEFTFPKREEIICNEFYSYITQNKQIVLDGFIRFRLKRYITLLNTIIDTSVNKFIIDREYMEFISLLKMYIQSQPCNAEDVHLIYKNARLYFIR